MVRNLYSFVVNEIRSLREIIRCGNRVCLASRNCPFYRNEGCPDYKHYGRLASWWAANKERKDTMKIWGYRK